MDPLHVAEALQRRRRLAGMTQAELARVMGTTQSSVSRAESGRVMPSVRFIARYAWATGRMLSMDIGPQARIRSAAVSEAQLEGDPVESVATRVRRARERMEQGEISMGEYFTEKLQAELDLVEARSTRV
ncbi:MAG: helix-turn-helix domain-containing protein [Actinobacteria bacterium]|nr:helix-turn-helix domain-containing protein [Actinomycetota bacterium]